MTEMMTRPYTLWPGNLDPALVDKAAWLFKELVALSTRLDAGEKQRWVDATDRAVEQLLGGARFELDPDGERVHFLSRSEAKRGYEHWNTTTAKACDCRGTTEGKICWNRPARHILRTLERWGVPVEPPLATAPAAAHTPRLQTCRCAVCREWAPSDDKAIEACDAGERREYHMFYKGDYIGSAPTYRDAETRLDEHVYELLRRGAVPTETERQADADEVASVERRAA